MEKSTADKGISIRLSLMILIVMCFFGNGFAVRAEGLRKDRVYKISPSVFGSGAQEGPEGSALEFTSSDDVVPYVRGQLKAKNKNITFDYVLSDAKVFKGSDTSEIQSMIGAFIGSEGSKIWADIERGLYKYTGVPNEGDYLRNSVYKTTVGKSATAEPVTGNQYKVTKICFKLQIDYFTNSDQEKEFENKAKEVVNSLNLSGDTEYEKVVKIYDYITNHVTYDYANLNNEGYLLKQSAYAALINKTSVCQGYATLFNYMANSAGLDSRIILGKSKKDEKSAEELHAWNAVRIGDRYYYVDATWDSANPEEDVYFLNGKGDFANHLDIHMDTPEGEKLPQEVIPLADYSYYKTVNKNYLSETKTVVTVGDVTTKNGYPAVNVDVVYNGKKLLRCVDYKVEYGIYNIDTYVWRITIRGIGLYQGDLPIDYLVPANMRQYIYQKEDKQNNTDNAQKNNTQNVSQKTLKVGAKFKVGKYTYKVTKAGGKKTVTLVAAGKNLKSVSIPASVRKNGDIYLVNAIGPNVFKNNSKLTSVVIGKNVKSIGANCFSGCKKLKKITFKGSSVNKVGKNSFKKTGSSVVVITPKSSKVKYAKLLKRGGISAKAKYK
ncbi:MAG: leucine-rich repeat protein [Eubacterium sp.]|nr:leucine-rich repeat protein [Eubacterium sp.]